MNGMRWQLSMAPRRRVIIDTDSGNDDVVALLFALAASPEELEVILISVVEGNVDVQTGLRNVMAVFHVLALETEWRKAKHLPTEFDGIKKLKPIVAIGASEPLQSTTDQKDYFHGRDGLSGSTELHPEFNPNESWKRLFEKAVPTAMLIETVGAISGSADVHNEKAFENFVPSHLPAYLGILRMLETNGPQTISIVALGPLIQPGPRSSRRSHNLSPLQ